MTQQQGTALVLRDGQGNVYAIPEDQLKRFRVPDDRKAEVEKTQGGGEVQGYAWNTWTTWNTTWNNSWSSSWSS